MERVFFKKKVFEKKVILNIKCKIEGVFSVLNSGDKKTEDSNEQDDVKNQKVQKKLKALPFPKGNDHLKL